MSKIHRIAGVLTSIVIAAAMAGCSASADDSNPSSSTEDNLGESAAPLARFAPHMKTLKDTLESGRPTEEIASSLLSSGRPAAFSLQAICRFYEDLDPQFKDMLSAFKGLEDGIGAYDKWNTFYQSAVNENRDAATLERLKTQRDAALTRFSQLLTDKKWLTTDGSPNRIKTTQDFLNAFDWKTRADDRRVVLGQLISELEEMKSTTYDMMILEHGNGVHELRRDLRWILIEQRALNGMVSLKSAGEACPIPAIASVPNDNRYGVLPATAVEPNPCQLNGCLVFAAAKSVSDLGDLKDQAEIEVNLNGEAEADVVPERLQAPAKKIYEDIRENDLLGVYISQLTACRDAL